jgi:hypothetical protein
MISPNTRHRGLDDYLPYTVRSLCRFGTCSPSHPPSAEGRVNRERDLLLSTTNDPLRAASGALPMSSHAVASFAIRCITVVPTFRFRPIFSVPIPWASWSWIACFVARSVRGRPIGFPLFVTPVAFTRANPARMLRGSLRVQTRQTSPSAENSALPPGVVVSMSC